MRPIWKGHIRFLLVAIPVRVYNAIESSEKIQFNQLHREDFGPIGYDKRCKKCGQVVTNEEITKGYQYESDRYAIVEPEEIAKVKIKTTKAVDIAGFVEASEIPSTFYDSPYYLGPDGPVAEKPFALLRQVLKDTGKVGLDRFRADQHRPLLRESGDRHFYFHVGSLDPPAVSFRSTHAPGLAVLFRNRVGEHFCGRWDNGVSPDIMTKSE